MNRLLIIRFSAMGDVAISVPVITSLALSNPELQVTVLTQQRMAPLFSWMPDNVEVLGVDLHHYHGIGGLGKLYGRLQEYHFDAVADIHDVLRTKYLRMRFRLQGTKVAVIDKTRAERKALLGHGMEHEALMPVTEKYAAVFRELGLKYTVSYTPPRIPESEQIFPFAVTSPAIGVAPFAAHSGKIYPLDMMKEVVDSLADSGMQVFLFGAGDQEKGILESWEREKVMSVVGKLGGLRQELILMSRLDMMISMDSSNMHMAAMMGTRTLSVWGATHPKAGFVAWNQLEESIVQVDMPCRPCSIYGSKPCVEGDYPCLRQISPQRIVDLVKKYEAQ
ncbi:MAG: glycosyltransferase family 9 protein [Bacteroidaceae bacterium]|nr:glycosyltransferase family 9 protein [Bacteroidaceae bacterium]